MTWSLPSDQGGGSYTVTSYRVYLQAANLSWHEDSTNCSGSNGTIISNRKCTIPGATLRAAPFSLAESASVNAKIVAINAIGDSPESDSGNGGTVPIADTVSGAPQSFTQTSLSADKTQATFTWSAPASDGGDAISSYRIEWDQGTNTFVEASASATSPYTKTGLTPGTTYKFKV